MGDYISMGRYEVMNKKIVTVDLDFFGSHMSRLNLGGLYDFLHRLKNFTILVQHHEILNYLNPRMSYTIINYDAHHDLYNDDDSIQLSNWVYHALKMNHRNRYVWMTSSVMAWRDLRDNSVICDVSYIRCKKVVDWSDNYFISLSPTYTSPEVISAFFDVMWDKLDFTDAERNEIMRISKRDSFNYGETGV